jgi:membrane protein required for colicin V production
VSTFDLAVLLVVAVSAAIGAWRGLIGEVLALLAWAIAIVAAWLFGPGIGESMFAGIKEPALRTLAGCGSIIVSVLLAMVVLKFLLRKALKALGLSLTDRVLGGVFGIVRGMAIVLVLVAAAGLTSIPKQGWWKEARLAPPLETVVLALRPMLPPDIGKRLRY